MSRYVVGNWKMNLLERDSLALVEKILASIEIKAGADVWVAPSFLSIPSVAQRLKGTGIKVGSQTVHGEQNGAFTGEVSCAMLREFGATFAIVGHSERRWVLGESDTVVAQKAAGALRQGITPVFCVGESTEERDRDLTHEVLRVQLTALMEEAPGDAISKMVVAYEPRWAIGTGKIPTMEQIADAHATVVNVTNEVTGHRPMAILYGGSVTPENFAQILEVPDVDGGLIGGASIVAESFAALVRIAQSAQ